MRKCRSVPAACAALLLLLGALVAPMAAEHGAVQSAQAAAAQPAVGTTKAPDGMVAVAAGPFIMGTDAGDKEGPNVPRQWGDARPQHQVTLPAFFIDRTEVTNSAYRRYCEATGYPGPPNWKNGSYLEGEAELPVAYVSWWEAAAYANWVGKRLPAEAEWEKAARGTDGRTFPWGNEWDASRVVTGRNKPSPVGSRTTGASVYGIEDLAGNVFEWVADWYQAYPGAPSAYPEFGTLYRVVRGGGFFGFESLYRTYYRSVARPDSRSEWIGFRCARSAA